MKTVNIGNSLIVKSNKDEIKKSNEIFPEFFRVILKKFDTNAIFISLSKKISCVI